MFAYRSSISPWRLRREASLLASDDEFEWDDVAIRKSALSCSIKTTLSILSQPSLQFTIAITIDPVSSINVDAIAVELLLLSSLC